MYIHTYISLYLHASSRPGDNLTSFISTELTRKSLCCRTSSRLRTTFGPLHCRLFVPFPRPRRPRAVKLCPQRNESSLIISTWNLFVSCCCVWRLSLIILVLLTVRALRISSLPRASLLPKTFMPPLPRTKGPPQFPSAEERPIPLQQMNSIWLHHAISFSIPPH
jgi:hypothetical protein